LATASLLIGIPAWSAALAFSDVDGVAQAMAANGVDLSTVPACWTTCSG
jgi:hypothetical protein